MNDRLPEPLRAPTPFSTPRTSDRLAPRSPKPTDPQRTFADKSLAQLARESFEAGFAAGSSNPIGNDSHRSLRAGPTDRHPHSSNDTLSGLIDALTPRRLEVLKLVARGLTNPEIASVLGLSANTVKAHLTGILDTLEVTNRTEAAIALQDYEAGQYGMELR